ncbi:hypothetical protein ABTO25_21435, partial [Acinetobacter baumannii]
RSPPGGRNLHLPIGSGPPPAGGRSPRLSLRYRGGGDGPEGTHPPGVPLPRSPGPRHHGGPQDGGGQLGPGEDRGHP